MFNAAHLHIAINHLPVVGFMAALALSICAFFTKNRMLDMTAWMFTAACAVTAVFSYLTGEPAEEMLEDVPGLSSAFLSAHERWGEWTYWAAIPIGILSLLGWYLARKKEDSDRKALVLLIVLLLAANFMGAVTASLGGDIRHPEIHSDQVTQMLTQFALQPEEHEMLAEEPAWQPAAEEGEHGESGEDVDVD